MNKTPIDNLIARAGDAGKNVLEHEWQRVPGDMHTLTRAEVEVFCIDPRLANDLAEALFRYEAMIGLIGGLCEPELRRAAQDRNRHPHLLKEDGGKILYSQFDAASFMHNECGLPYDQCYAWVFKNEFTLWRSGLFEMDSDDVSFDYLRRMKSDRNKMTSARLLYGKEVKSDASHDESSEVVDPDDELPF
jgi:hypothetical protein